MSSMGQASAGTILHVSILDCPYPITIDTIHSVFAFHGAIQRIVLLNKNSALLLLK